MSVPDEMAFPVRGCLDQPFISGIFPSGKNMDTRLTRASAASVRRGLRVIALQTPVALSHTMEDAPSYALERTLKWWSEPGWIGGIQLSCVRGLQKSSLMREPQGASFNPRFVPMRPG